MVCLPSFALSHSSVGFYRVLGKVTSLCSLNPHLLSICMLHLTYDSSVPPSHFPSWNRFLGFQRLFVSSLYCSLISFSSSNHLVSGGVSPKCPTTLNPCYGSQNRKRHRRTEEGKEKIKKKIDQHHPPIHIHNPHQPDTSTWKMINTNTIIFSLLVFSFLVVSVGTLHVATKSRKNSLTLPFSHPRTSSSNPAKLTSEIIF